MDVLNNVKNALIKQEELNEKYNFNITSLKENDVLNQFNELKVLKEKNTDNLKLEGLIYSAKDNFNTKNILTTGASAILDNYIPIYDATVISKLKNEGTILISKTNMDELGMGGDGLNSNYGLTKNPYDETKIVGGSSSGSAAIVALGLTHFALGTDTGDSIRKPASYAGVVGIKPTYGRISRYGVIPYASSLDHVGVFANTVENVSKVLEVISGRDDKDFTSSFEEVDEYTKFLNDDISGKHLIVINEVIESMENETETLKLFNNVLNILKEKNVRISYVSFDKMLLEAILPTYSIIANSEASANHSNLTGVNFGHTVEGKDTEDMMKKTRTRGFSTQVKSRFIIGSFGLFKENQKDVFVKAKKIRRLITFELKEILKNADGIILPATPTTAPNIEDVLKEKDTINFELNSDKLISENHLGLANLAGYPSITIPMGKIKNMPIGVNLTFNPFKEKDMLNISNILEKELKNKSEKQIEKNNSENILEGEKNGNI